MKSNLEWEKWGERDPLYAVSTWKGKERGSPDAWRDAEFYELGRSDWSDFLRHWQNYGEVSGHCVEIGCGAGRLTKHLADHFQRITALDVSQHQLNYARERIVAPNVTFTISDGSHLPVGDRSCDAVFSAHVFQHFECHSDAYSVFCEIHRALVDGGTMLIHLPCYEVPNTRAGRTLSISLAFEKRIIDFKSALRRRQLRQGKWKPLMRYLRFDRRQLIRQLQNIGFSNVEFCMFAMRSNHDYHEVVLASKRGAPSGKGRS